MNEVQLKEAAWKLPEPPPGQRFSWNFKRTELLNDMRWKDGSRFLTWPTICESFYQGRTSRTEIEEAEVSQSRYAPLVYSEDFGGADDIPHFIHQLYILNHLDKCGADLSNVSRVHEFGSGFGAMPLMFYRMGHSGEYSIRDYPEVHLLRQYYLSNTRCRLETSPIRQVDCDLFMALSSISEVRPEDRYLFVSDAEFYLFALSRSWDGVDNMKWFSDFCEMKRNHRWKMFDTTHPSKCCLVGVPK